MEWKDEEVFLVKVLERDMLNCYDVWSFHSSSNLFSTEQTKCAQTEASSKDTAPKQL